MRKKSVPREHSKQNGARPGTERLPPSKTKGLQATGAIAPRMVAAPKSLMKTSELGARGAGLGSAVVRSAPPPAPMKPRRRKVSLGANDAGRQQKIEERIATATEELASGI